MDQLIILHSNDIHGRTDGLARIATLVSETRAENARTPVLYFDAGDSEEASVRISNLTKGTGMHRLLRVAGVQAAVVGNAAPARYGAEVLRDHAAAGGYPLLLANLRSGDGELLPGTVASTIISAGRFRIGLIGVTTNENVGYEQFFGLRLLPILPLVRELTADLQRDGVDAVIMLSHLGLLADRELAAALPELTAIIGGHTHDLLPEGEWIGGVLIAQTGNYAEHLGWIDLRWDGERLKPVEATVLEIVEDIEPAEAVLEEVAAVEADLAIFLDEIVGELAEPLDFSTEHECGVANLTADMLRERCGAEVGLILAGQAFTGPLPAGPLRRGTLWDVCSSTANPGVVTMRGDRLLALVVRGQDPAFAAQRPRPLRGVERGLIHLSGASWCGGQLLIAGQPVEPEREYRVAASDYELEQYGGYTDSSWDLQPSYDVPTILREALEAYLADHSPVSVTGGRLCSG